VALLKRLSARIPIPGLGGAAHGHFRAHRIVDPLIYAGVSVAFTTVAALACLVPSIRASRIDPLLALPAD